MIKDLINPVMPYSIFILFISCCFISFSCDYPENFETQKIIGEWFNEDYGEYARENSSDTLSYISRFEMNFDENNIIKTERIMIDKETNTFLGYRYKSEGKYYLSGSHLMIVTDKAAYNDDQNPLYSASLELKQISPETETVSYRITKDTLVFIYPPCGPYANCISTQSFYRRNY